jgi:hypothetical protein
MNLLLIHSLVRDKQIVIDSITADTRYIIIDYELDDLQNIKDKISAFNLSFERIGLFQENDNRPYYQLTRKSKRSTLYEVQTSDPELKTWDEFIDLLNYCKTNGMTDFDIMDCNIVSDTNWEYVIKNIENKLNININASENETGNSAMNGDWILEKGNVNLIGTYFTENIKEYKYVLGGGGSFGNHTIIIKDDGNVYACGWNFRGRLGIGSDIPDKELTLIQMIRPNDLPSTAKAIKAATGNFSLVLYDNGSVYACGSNQFGQLGIGNTDNESTLIKMKRPTDLPSTAKAINISGGYHSLVLYDN